MNLLILTPEKELYNGPISSVKVPGENGQFEILKDHAPLVSALTKGEVRVLTENNDKQVFEISSGFVEVLKNEVSVLVQQLKD